MRARPSTWLAAFVAFGMLVATLASTIAFEQHSAASSEGSCQPPMPSTVGSSPQEDTGSVDGQVGDSWTEGPRASVPASPTEDAGSGELGRLVIYSMDAVLLYRNPSDRDDWLPLPSETEYNLDHGRLVSFPNGTMQEVHGRVFERIVDPTRTTYLNASSRSNLTVKVYFDGELVPGGVIPLGNRTTIIEPFHEDGNGTFQFILDIDKPAGMYIVEVVYEGSPPEQSPMLMPMRYRAVIGVSHPTAIKLQVTPEALAVGQSIDISGRLVDDMYRPVTGCPLRILFDGTLVGPSSDGVYIDDVEVLGTGFSDDFESQGLGGWSVRSVPGRGAADQWRHGSPVPGHGPPSARSGSLLVGTVLDGDYQRGAWSYLVSPLLDLAPDTTYALRFWSWWSLYGADDYAYVAVSVDGGMTWDDAGAVRFTGADLVSDGWRPVEVDLTRYQGESDVRLAFVLFSADKSLDVQPDGTFGYRYVPPMTTAADRHRLTAAFDGTPLQRPCNASRDVRVMRIVHFELDANSSTKVGHRNESMTLIAWLKDNEGEVLRSSIQGIPRTYMVMVYPGGGPPTVPEPIGMEGRMDALTGKVVIDYDVPWDQSLRPLNVTFLFRGSDYYTPAEDIDVYRIKAETYIEPQPEDQRYAQRGGTMHIWGHLRVVPSQSTGDRVKGDPIYSEFIRIYSADNLIGNRRTRWDGTFEMDNAVPESWNLGEVIVSYDFRADYDYEQSIVDITFTILAGTSIELKEQVVYKGAWVWIEGTIRDDRGEPVVGMPIYIIWKRAPEIGRAVSELDGVFRLQFYIEFEDRAGDITVIARFKGTETYNASEGRATWTLRSGSVLREVDRVDRFTPFDEFHRYCRLTRDGSTIPIVGESILLYVDGAYVASALTSSDGTASFTVNVPLEPDLYDGIPILYLYNGSRLYDGSQCASIIILRPAMLVTVDDLYVNDANVAYEGAVLRFNDSVHGVMWVRDAGGRAMQNALVDMYVRIEGTDGSEWHVRDGTTDANGHFGFQLVLRHPACGELSFLVKCGDLMAFTTEVRYIVPPSPSNETVIHVSGDLYVTVGETMHLEVGPARQAEWDADNLTYRLASPPSGMSISDGGSIEWSPDTGQVGSQKVIVWLYDGNSSKTAEFVVTVRPDGVGADLGAVAIFSVLLLAVLVLMGMRLKARRTRPSA